MDKRLFLTWLKINLTLFGCSFAVGLLLAILFPDVMLGFVRDWGARSISISSVLLGEAATQQVLFFKIFAWNGLVSSIFFMTSLVLLAPLISVITGLFYSLGFVSSFSRSIFPVWHSAALIAIETMFIILTITFSSVLGSEIFSVKPKRKDIIHYWKYNWKRLIPEIKRSPKDVFIKNKKELIFFIAVITILILFGAWFETMI